MKIENLRADLEPNTPYHIDEEEDDVDGTKNGMLACGQRNVLDIVRRAVV